MIVRNTGRGYSDPLPQRANMTTETPNIWHQFDALIAEAQSTDAKTAIAAMKLQSELFNLRLQQLKINTSPQPGIFYGKIACRQ